VLNLDVQWEPLITTHRTQCSNQNKLSLPDTLTLGQRPVTGYTPLQQRNAYYMPLDLVRHGAHSQQVIAFLDPRVILEAHLPGTVPKKTIPTS
jgi:hypothetical protein